MPRTCCLLILLLAFSAAPLRGENNLNMTLEADVNGKKLSGRPLSWSDDRVYLLERDGRLAEFRPEEAKNFKKASGNFHGYSAGEMRLALERELGDKLEVTGTGHYLVAHPRGQGEQWAERFEDLYRSFVHYFSVRGFQVQEPQFPLVAIVWNKQADFVRYAQSEGAAVGPGVLGYYSPTSNRITLFDSTSKNDKNWQQNASTIIHEATHQTAFNTGVHSRFGLPPRWVGEGLGTLYEAPGLWDPRTYTQQSDRINRGRLAQFRQYLASGRPSGAFLEIINSDRQFQTNPAAAYAEAWALTFFLSETEPRKYNQYLAKTAALPPFGEYPAARRLADFTSVFGSDLKMLEANYLRFIEGLK